jgi:hypothetical protein
MFKFFSPREVKILVSPWILFVGFHAVALLRSRREKRRLSKRLGWT